MIRILVLALAVLAATVPAQQPDGQEIAKGRVVDELGNAIKGATVVVKSLEGTGNPVTTGKDGRFRIVVPATRTASYYTPSCLVISAKGRLSGMRMTRSPYFYYYGGAMLTGDIDTGDLLLPKAIPINGTIRQDGGRPMQGATVVAIPLGAMLTNNPFNYTALGLTYFSKDISDAKGRVRLWCLQNSGVAVRVEAEGHYLHNVAHASPFRPLDVQLVKSGMLQGQVVGADGKPVRSQLFVNFEALHRYQQSPFQMVKGTTLHGLTETDAEGRFRVNIDYPGRFRFRAVALSGTYVNIYQGTQSKVFTGPEQGYRFELPNSAQKVFTVKALGPEGKPVAGFRGVAVWQQSSALNRGYMDVMFRQAISAKKPGELQLKGPLQGQPNVGKVMIKAKGFAPYISKELTWDDDKPPTVEARLIKESAIAGVVLDPVGKPVAGATVAATFVPEKKKAAAMRGRFIATPYGGQSSNETKTNEKGEFRIAALDKGKYELSVKHAERSDSKKKKVEVQAEATLKDVKLESPPGVALKGSFKSKKIPPGVRLRLVRSVTHNNPFGAMLILQSGGSHTGPEAEIDKDGKFEFESLPKGTYTAALLFPARGFDCAVQVHVKSVIVKDKAPNVDGIDIEPFLPAQVKGRIQFDGMGVDMDRLLVIARNTGGVVPGGSAYGHVSRVKPDGTYRLQLKPGSNTDLAVLDAATGIVLATAQTEALEPGKLLEQDFEPQVGRVKVRFETKKKDAPFGASFLTVLATGQQNTFTGMFLFQQQQVPSGSGVPIPVGQREIILYLPVRELRLILRSGAGLLQATAAHTPIILGSEEVSPDAKKTKKVTIQVEEAPEIEDADADAEPKVQKQSQVKVRRVR